MWALHPDTRKPSPPAVVPGVGSLGSLSIRSGWEGRPCRKGQAERPLPKGAPRAGCVGPHRNGSGLPAGAQALAAALALDFPPPKLGESRGGCLGCACAAAGADRGSGEPRETLSEQSAGAIVRQRAARTGTQALGRRFPSLSSRVGP